MNTSTPEQIWTHLSEVIAQMLAGRGEEPGALTKATRINTDLGMSSIEVLEVMVLLEDRLAHPLSFQDLFVRDGEYVDDLALGELHAFTYRTLNMADDPAVGVT